jgi:ribosomal protein L40E
MIDAPYDAQPATAQPATKICRDCAERIPDKARKCGHCDAYQDWRRVIFLSNSTLSLLVALVAVLAFAIPIIKSALTPRYERVTARVVSQGYQQSLGKTAIIVVLSNSGTVSAFVDPSASLTSGKRHKWFGVDLLPSVNSSKDYPSRSAPQLSDLMLPPSSQRVVFGTLREDAPTISDPAPDVDCELTVTVFKLDGSKRDEKHAYRCFDWRALFGGANR